MGIMGSNWVIEKFTASNDFGMLMVKMQTILTLQKCAKALKGGVVMSAKLTKARKLEMTDKAKSVVVLCLGDKVSRDVPRDATRASMWTRLE